MILSLIVGVPCCVVEPAARFPRSLYGLGEHVRTTARVASAVRFDRLTTLGLASRRPCRWGVRKVFSTEDEGEGHGGPRVRRETGRRRGCKSLTMKGRANRIGPESCVAGREARDEALTGVTVGQVLSRESSLIRDADAVCGAEGNTAGCVNASALPVPRGLRPWHAVETFCLGTGRSHVWPRCEGRSALGRPEGRSQ